ncbi:uncharacterized protein LOC115621933 [Scaptodrosophila lebanonensis]|uniref:Uncharacterized protein LOC115621933 n=1 Tax=Drosophila lebanonensis TaxID=7225 RepID=A0A6J2T9Q2_DROLE|nr:uncharacterized protein LOC115621933 [Scaptodrosophila lebanonensis]
MACRCKYFIKILEKCCCCVSLRLGALLVGCIFLTWFFYLTVGSAFAMECIFPNEYQRDVKEGYGPPAALKTTMVFSFFGFLTAGMVCLGVHNNNELMFIPFLVLVPLYIIVHILAMVLYKFVWSVVFIFVLTIIILIYCWCVIWSYYVELRFAYDEDLPPPTSFRIRTR